MNAKKDAERTPSLYELAAMDLSPPYNLYSGRDTSHWAMTDFGPSLTKQEFADECDVNKIMERYNKTGVLPQSVDRSAFYFDADEMPWTFQEMQNILIDARNAFAALPAVVRKEFDNDPVAFAEFANDPKNVDKLREWNMLSDEAVSRLDAARAAEAAKAAEQAQAAQRAAESKPPAD